MKKNVKFEFDLPVVAGRKRKSRRFPLIFDDSLTIAELIQEAEKHRIFPNTELVITIIS